MGVVAQYTDSIIAAYDRAQYHNTEKLAEFAIMSAMNKQLHWSQRVALVRHNLHTASRSGDFTFFKTIQAQGLMSGTNHVATLSAEMGDDADTVLAAMDNLNAGLAYVHQDAFQNVFDSLKSSLRDNDEDDTMLDGPRAKLYVDTTMQRNMADMAIDKMTGSTIALINQQPEHAQEAAANVWITGATIIVDCVEVALQQMLALDKKMDDFIRMEESWNTVKASVATAITGLKGVFSLMDQAMPSSPVEAKTTAAARSASIASAGANMFRRMSSAFVPSAPPAHASSRTSSNTSQAPPAPQSATHSRSNSISSSNSAPIYRTPNYVRNSVSAGCPISMPPNTGWSFAQHKLSMIPPTPAVEEPMDPFDTSAAPPVPTMPNLLDMPSLPDMPAMQNMHMGERQSLMGLV